MARAASCTTPPGRCAPRDQPAGGEDVGLEEERLRAGARSLRARPACPGSSRHAPGSMPRRSITAVEPSAEAHAIDRRQVTGGQRPSVAAVLRHATGARWSSPSPGACRCHRRRARGDRPGRRRGSAAGRRSARRTTARRRACAPPPAAHRPGRGIRPSRRARTTRCRDRADAPPRAKPNFAGRIVVTSCHDRAASVERNTPLWCCTHSRVRRRRALHQAMDVLHLRIVVVAPAGSSRRTCRRTTAARMRRRHRSSTRRRWRRRSSCDPTGADRRRSTRRRHRRTRRPSIPCAAAGPTAAGSASTIRRDPSTGTARPGSCRTTASRADPRRPSPGRTGTTRSARRVPLLGNAGAGISCQLCAVVARALQLHAEMPERLARRTTRRRADRPAASRSDRRESVVPSIDQRPRARRNSNSPFLVPTSRRSLMASILSPSRRTMPETRRSRPRRSTGSPRRSRSAMRSPLT